MLGKAKLDTIKVLIYKVFIDSYISHDKFVSVDYVLEEYNEMREKNKKILEVGGIHYINLVDISRETYEKNGVETILKICEKLR